MPNDNGECCTWVGGLQNNTAGYNITSFKYIVVASKFAQNDLVTVTFNAQENNTLAQYYEFFNDRSSVRNENIGVFAKMNIYGWVTVVNLGKDYISGATVKVMFYPDSIPANGRVVQQRVTQSISGTGLPGAAIALDRDLDYIIITSKEGYKTDVTKLKGIDFENNGGLQIQLKPLDNDQIVDTVLLGPNTYSNETNILFPVSAAKDTAIYYSTTYNTNKRMMPVANKGTIVILLNNTDYITGQNITLMLYRYNSTATTYEEITRKTIEYRETIVRDATTNVTENRVTTGLLLVAMIVIASVLGILIKRDGKDTGYFIFGGASILVGIFYTPLLPVGIITILSVAGSLIFTTTRE